MSTMPTGTVQLHAGPTQTGRANFDLTFIGKGGYASMSQLSNDAIVSRRFCLFCSKKPACFFYVGCQPKDGGGYPHHNPKFMMNEDCLIICAKSAASVIWHYFA